MVGLETGPLSEREQGWISFQMELEPGHRAREQSLNRTHVSAEPGPQGGRQQPANPATASGPLTTYRCSAFETTASRSVPGPQVGSVCPRAPDASAADWPAIHGAAAHSGRPPGPYAAQGGEPQTYNAGKETVINKYQQIANHYV